jgi:hypothetical protein
LVIDNNSRDHTRSVVVELRARATCPALHCRNQSGLDHARNRAITEARGDIILFGDERHSRSPRLDHAECRRRCSPIRRNGLARSAGSNPGIPRRIAGVGSRVARSAGVSRQNRTD